MTIVSVPTAEDSHYSHSATCMESRKQLFQHLSILKVHFSEVIIVSNGSLKVFYTCRLVLF